MRDYSRFTAQFGGQVKALTDYAEYNYGRNHKITIACKSGDAEQFMEATRHITEMTDMRIVQLQNKMICAAIDNPLAA